MDAKLKFPWFTGRMGPLALVPSACGQTEMTFFPYKHTVFRSRPWPENINLAAKTSVWWDNEFPNIIGFWGTLSVGTKPVIEVMYYIYKISSNITIQLCFICHPKKIWTSLNIHMVFDFDHFSRESHLSQSSQSLCSHRGFFRSLRVSWPSATCGASSVARRTTVAAVAAAPRVTAAAAVEAPVPWMLKSRSWARAGNPRIMTA